jgi:hypothetical protein
LIFMPDGTNPKTQTYAYQEEDVDVAGPGDAEEDDRQHHAHQNAQQDLGARRLLGLHRARRVAVLLLLLLLLLLRAPVVVAVATLTAPAFTAAAATRPIALAPAAGRGQIVRPFRRAAPTNDAAQPHAPRFRHGCWAAGWEQGPTPGTMGRLMGPLDTGRLSPRRSCLM